MRGLRGMMVLSVVLLFGCAQYQTLEELELAAIQSGDWSAVEKRERAMEKRRARQGPQCGQGAVAYCVDRGGSALCQCASRESINRALRGW